MSHGRAGAVAVAMVGVAAELLAIRLAPTGADRWNELSVGLVVFAYAAIGLVILWHRPHHLIGRSAVAVAASWGVGEALVQWSAGSLAAQVTAGAALASVVGGFLRGLPWLLVVLWFPVRFPEGLPPSSRLGRVGERLAFTTIACFTAFQLFSPTLDGTGFAGVDNPIGLPAALAGAADVVGTLCLALGAASVAVAVACLVQRYRGGGPLGRQQVAVFGIAFALPVLPLMATFLGSAPPWVFALASLPLPVAISVAVLQQNLYDLPMLVNRSLTYGALWLSIAALYALVVGGVGATLSVDEPTWAPWVAAGVVAVSFGPLRDALQRAANKVTYGQWSEPAEVLAATVRRLADASEVPGLLQTLVDDLGEGLRLGYVAVVDSGGRTLVSHGVPPGELDSQEIQAYGVPLATLRWTRRDLRDGDRALVSDLAVQLGAIVHAMVLLDEVRASQERLVAAGEEERRRLRRDLHDGLGPALAGLSLKVDTVRNQLGDGIPEASQQALLGLRGGIQSTVEDVRRIVEGLRPPALDELGLVEALGELALRLGADANLKVEVEVRQPLAELPAAVEVACYRIVSEALTNVIRHSRATRAVVTLRCEDGWMRVEVMDDGRGLDEHRRHGVGLGSMLERAREIGGDLTVAATQPRGTAVVARLPASPRVRT
jgi:signal transduction histidine kinase